MLIVFFFCVCRPSHPLPPLFLPICFALCKHFYFDSLEEILDSINVQDLPVDDDNGSPPNQLPHPLYREPDASTAFTNPALYTYFNHSSHYASRATQT
nr:hypothetical protein Iba_chr06aCG11310 [Ipomoea batatas]